MPFNKKPKLLQNICSENIASIIFKTLVRLENAQLSVKLDIGSNPSSKVDYIIKEILHWREAMLPTLLLEKVNISLVQLYCKIFHLRRTEVEGILIHGMQAVWALQQVAKTENKTYQYDDVFVVKIDNILGFIMSPNLKVLDFNPWIKLGAVSEPVFNIFSLFLNERLGFMNSLTELYLNSNNSSNSLPQCDDHHLSIIGHNCPLLEILDISFNKNITDIGLKCLLPSNKVALIRSGCQYLKKLLIFDCMLYAKDVASVVYGLKNLVYLGYKETGKVVKILLKYKDFSPYNIELNLTHIDNTGSKTRKLVASSLRCKKQLSLAIGHLCKNVKNLKLRVTDEDVRNLANLEKLATVEFVYNTGNLHSPGQGTLDFLKLRGANLTSIALICNTMNMCILEAIGKFCPNITQLWSRSNFFSNSRLNEFCFELDIYNHDYFQDLSRFYIRVGENELSLVHFPDFVLPFILKNTSNLKELIIAARCSIITDEYIQNLIVYNDLNQLEKFFVVIPAVNSLPNIINLTKNTVDFIINFCPNIKKIGNLLSWHVDKEEYSLFQKMILDNNFELEILHQRMIMR